MAKKAKKKVVRRAWTKNDVRELKSLAERRSTKRSAALMETNCSLRRAVSRVLPAPNPPS